MLKNLSVEQFLEDLATADTPGSGSVAALVGAAGIGQLLKVVSRNDFAASGQMAAELQILQQQAAAIIDEDAAVVAEALPLLLSIGADGSSAEWNDILSKAAAVMFKLAKYCQRGLQLARQLLQPAAKNWHCDIKAAAMNCHAASQSALMLAELNVSLLREDMILSDNLRARVNELSENIAVELDYILA